MIKSMMVASVPRSGAVEIGSPTDWLQFNADRPRMSSLIDLVGKHYQRVVAENLLECFGEEETPWHGICAWNVYKQTTDPTAVAAMTRDD